MKSRTLFYISIFALLVIILTACNLPASNVVTQEPGLVYTQAAQTADAILTQSPATSTSIPTIMVTPIPATPTTGPATSTSEPTVTHTSVVPTATAAATATTAGTACTNQANYVSDVTVPDDTEMQTGQDFTKTWRLENTGTCTWSTQYALVFAGGDQMNGISPSPLTASVEPGRTADVSIALKAPGTVGTYRGNWQLQNASGVKFGTGNNADQAFYVQIKVVEGTSGLNLGTPAWTDNMDNANYWYLLDTENTKFTEGNGVLVMKSIKPGESEEWDLSNRPAVKDFYMQATFIVGDTCSGLDRYGLFTRAAGPNEGYVYEFSCDGRFRLYKWDGEHYNAIQEWRASASIKVGPKQTNVMGIWMQGSTIRLYANGFKLAEFTDTTYDEGKFGLAIGSASTENFTVSVDKVELWELK